MQQKYEMNTEHAMGKPHAVLVPYPMQGHVIPYMELSICLVKRGFKVTFVNTDFNHKRAVDALTLHNKEEQLLYYGEERIRMVSIPDGLAAEADRNDLKNLCKAMRDTIPVKLEELIKETMLSNFNGGSDEISCVVSDMGSVLEVAEKMGIKRAAFWTLNASHMALVFNVQKLIDAGIINSDGTLIKDQMIQLSPHMPAMSTSHLVWICLGDLEIQKLAFEAILQSNEVTKLANLHLCNSTHELEPAAFELIPHVLPIGPLLASSQLDRSIAGHFWAQDSTCLNWLDQQQPLSVIYVAFGSHAMFDRTQFHEIALGLELLNRPFLWIVRPGIITGTSTDYPDGFEARVANRAKMATWANQKKVLGHPSIACFVSHCGWNSTMEGVANGVPFLCWPYFADQFMNQTSICNVWKVGLGLSRGGEGVVSRFEIKEKLEELIGDEGIRRRVSEYKEIARKSVSECGSSTKNLDYFAKEMK